MSSNKISRKQWVKHAQSMQNKCTHITVCLSMFHTCLEFLFLRSGLHTHGSYHLLGTFVSTHARWLQQTQTSFQLSPGWHFQNTLPAPQKLGVLHTLASKTLTMAAQACSVAAVVFEIPSRACPDVNVMRKWLLAIHVAARVPALYSTVMLEMAARSDRGARNECSGSLQGNIGARNDCSNLLPVDSGVPKGCWGSFQGDSASRKHW